MATGGTHKDFKLVVPDRVVWCVEGDDVTLCCHLSPETSAVAMEIRWFRDTDCIYLYRSGHVIEGRGYEGRVSVDPQQLQRGGVSLTLRSSRGGDYGVHTCQVISGGHLEEERVVLRVRGIRAAVSDLVGIRAAVSGLMGIRARQEITAEERKKMEESVQSLVANNQEEQIKQLQDTIQKLQSRVEQTEQKTERGHQAGVEMGLNPVLTSTADKEFDLEWRKTKWDIGSRNRMERELREFRLNPELKHLRILLHGPVGAGKSSFINSINSVFQGQICSGALVAAESAISFTKKYKTHKFRNGNSGHLPFVVNDIMGLEKGNSVGTHPSDIINALKGHVKNNYKFNPVSPLSVGDADYVASPSLNDRVHCLVSVIPLDKISIMDDEVINKMRAIREAASDMDIPQAIVMTMVDKACPVVKEDLRKIYFSKRIKQNMQECSNRLGVPMNCIFPVKNYHEEIELDLEMDCLILTALGRIVHFSHEYIDSLDD